jgi:hypothetical protein
MVGEKENLNKDIEEEHENWIRKFRERVGVG